MRIAHVAAEVTPWSQSGGLAEVVGALPAAQRRMGDDAVVVTPLYRCVRERAAGLGAAVIEGDRDFELAFAETTERVRVCTVDHPAAEGIHFVDAPHLYDRAGLYGEGGGDYGDNALRFAVLARAAAVALPELVGSVDVLHAHDWQAGLAPWYARALSPAPATVLTIHNLAYQGDFDKQWMDRLGLPWSLFTHEQLELWDRVSFLKAGVALSDATTTVSPRYATEITTPEGGHGLDGFLRHQARRLTGIVNGIDTASWDPATDPALPANFSADDLSGKRACRRQLAEQMGFEVADDELLCGVVSRFAHQKGLDVIAAAAPSFAELGVRLVVLGTGDPALERWFELLAANPAMNTAARIDFDVTLARRIYAGCDAVLMPSRFEPCGLNQLYAMRYGAVPIVHAVGGLRDTVIDPGDDGLKAGDGTGFCFEHCDATGLRWALGRAAALYREPGSWRTLIRAAMAADWSWTSSAGRYRDLYGQLPRPRGVE